MVNIVISKKIIVSKILVLVTDISSGASSELAMSNNCCITSVPKII